MVSRFKTYIQLRHSCNVYLQSKQEEESVYLYIQLLLLHYH